jgi:hypothetical protein
MSMSGESAQYCYLMQTIAWMGGNREWPADMIAEQLGEFDDQRVLEDLEAAAGLGLLTLSDDGYRLTEAGWVVGADVD